MIVDTMTVYYSNKNKQPLDYTKTHNAAFRYLGYRDVPQIIKKYLQAGRALDYGSGAGYSTQFLNKLGFNAIGVDNNKEMVHQAKLQHPDLLFYYIENRIIPFKDSIFDLIFSGFVLLEMSSKKEIIDYLLEAKRVMKKSSSLFVAITASENICDTSKKWLDFTTNFPENKNLASGSLIKVYNYDSHIEFSDYYWTQADYQNCFTRAGFNIVEVNFPLGNKEDPYAWQDELVTSPFAILVAINK